MNANVKQISKTTDVDERVTALSSNEAAVTALASTVAGTLGPKGLDCMLVDRFGDVTVTNDGATILDKIDTAHPAAKMLIKAARAQEEEIGDGTTTTAILAAALISECAACIARGVPIAKVIEGMRVGIAEALHFIESKSLAVQGVDDDILTRVAVIAARGNGDIAKLVVEAAQLVGEDRLRTRGFSLADTIMAKEGASNEVFAGIIIDKQRASRQMPKEVENTKVLIVDDALEPQHVENDALATESGFARHLALQEEFIRNIEKLLSLGVGFVAVAKGIDPTAEELFTDAGVLAVRRLSPKDVARLAELTGARTIKRSGLRKEPAEMECFLGWCDRVYEDEKLDHIRVIGSKNCNAATILIGASTREVKDERDRIARDAAGAVQAAVRFGVVPGGGSIEIGAANHVGSISRKSVRGTATYGVDAVASALKRPLAQIVANAGFNSLEKVEEVLAAQSDTGNCALGIDCDTGEIVDMMELGVVDPTGVKLYAVRTAAEVAEAILRINMIIRKRDESSAPLSAES
jgi:chaperonin GroEL (HSP60 family)